MLRLVVLFLLFTIYANAITYYAKAEPIYTYSIKSSVSGKVIFVDKSQEAKIANGSRIIKIDDKLDLINLKTSQEKLKLINKNIELTNKNLINAKKIYNIEQKNYNNIKNLRTKAQTQKDAKLLSLINTKNTLLKIEQSLESLKSQKLIERLFKEGKTLKRYPIKVIYLRDDFDFDENFLTAFSVPKKKFKRAVDRNRIKRLMREAFRLQQHGLPAGQKSIMMWIYTGKEMPDYQSVYQSIGELIKKSAVEKA